MLFPGYPSQFVGMGKDLYDNSRVVQEYYEEASNCLSINFVKLCFASSDAELSKIPNAYPALYLVGASTAAMIKELFPNMQIVCVAGHGVGEYSALSAASVLSLPDGLYLLSKLSQFYGTMREDLDAKSVTVHGLTARQLEALCEELSASEGSAHIAVYETKTEHIVSGTSEVVDALADSANDATSAKVKVKEVGLEDALHTPLLDEVAKQLKTYLTKVDFKDPQMPIVTGINGKLVYHAKKAQDAIIRQIVQAIHWSSVLKQFADLDMILVPAPSKALVAELEALYPDKIILGIDTMADLAALGKHLKAAENCECEFEPCAV